MAIHVPAETAAMESEIVRLEAETQTLGARLTDLVDPEALTEDPISGIRGESFDQAIKLTSADHRQAEAMARIGSWSRDLLTGLSTWSAGKLLIFGLDPDGPTPPFESTLQFIHPDDRESVVKSIALAIETNQPQDLVYRIQTPSGQKTLESQVRPFLQDQRLVGTVRDVTEARLAASELAEKEKNLRAIVDNLNEGLLLKAPSGVIEMANPAAEILLGCSVAEMMGCTTHDPRWRIVRLDGSVMPAPEHPADRVIATRTAHRDIVMGIEHPDGHTKWLRCSGIPLFDDSGTELRGILCTFVDFTDHVNAENKLAEINALRGAILASADCSIISTDTDGTILSFNHAAEQMFGYPQEEVIGAATLIKFHTPFEIASRASELGIEPSVRVLFHEALNGCVEEREWTLVRQDGSIFPAMVTVTAMRTEEKRLLGFLGVARDISRSKANEEALRASEARLNEAQRLAKSGSWETDILGGRTTWSAGLFELLGLEPNSSPPSPTEFLALIHHEDRPAFLAAYEAAEELGESFDIEFRLLRSPGEMITLHAFAHVYHREGAPVRILGNVQDISERKAAHRQIEWQMRTISSYAAELEAGKQELEKVNARLEALAITDGLTGIMNHRAFQDRIDQEFKRARRYESALSMLLIDVDNFKSYNDSFGHQAGDEVLRAVAKTLQLTGRQTDWIARYGGEEFVVILPETGLESALDAAERFRVAVSSRALGSRELNISVGVATLTKNHVRPAHLVSDSDRALYFAKANGRNRVAWVDPATGNPLVGQ